ncbi:hypothetical protein Tco_1186954, partial [Tanacetum coccineum]
MLLFEILVKEAFRVRYTFGVSRERVGNGHWDTPVRPRTFQSKNRPHPGSILGVEVQLIRKSYKTQLVVMDEKGETESVGKPEDGGFLKPNIFTLTIPQVDGGSNISVKVKWSQKISYKDGEFTLAIPFSFPEYVTPAGKKLSKKEKIELNVNVGLGTEVVCRSASHPLKEQKRVVEKLAFLYEAEVLAWSSTDFVFTYA